MVKQPIIVVDGSTKTEASTTEHNIGSNSGIIAIGIAVLASIAILAYILLTNNNTSSSTSSGSGGSSSSGSSTVTVNPTLYSSVKIALLGTNIQFTGTGYTPNGSITLSNSINGTSTQTADSNGNLNTSYFPVLSITQTPQTITFTATDDSTNISSSTISVQFILPNASNSGMTLNLTNGSTNVNLDSTVSFTGSGYARGTQVALYDTLGGSSLHNIDSSGNLTITGIPVSSITTTAGTVGFYVIGQPLTNQNANITTALELYMETPLLPILTATGTAPNISIQDNLSNTITVNFIGSSPTLTSNAPNNTIATTGYITLSGTGYTPNSTMVLTNSLEGYSISTGTVQNTDSNGSFTTGSFPVSDISTTQQTVLFKGVDSSGSVSNVYSLNITSTSTNSTTPTLVPSATSVLLNGTISFTGSGYMPNSVVTLTNSLGGSSTQVTNSSGSFSTGTFNVSTITTSTGAVTFTATDSSGDKSPIVTVNFITSTTGIPQTGNGGTSSQLTLSYSPQPVPINQTVTITGTGYSISSKVILTNSNGGTLNLVSDSSGNINTGAIAVTNLTSSVQNVSVTAYDTNTNTYSNPLVIIVSQAQQSSTPPSSSNFGISTFVNNMPVSSVSLNQTLQVLISGVTSGMQVQLNCNGSSITSMQSVGNSTVPFNNTLNGYTFLYSLTSTSPLYNNLSGNGGSGNLNITVNTGVLNVTSSSQPITLSGGSNIIPTNSNGSSNSTGTTATGNPRIGFGSSMTSTSSIDLVNGSTITVNCVNIPPNTPVTLEQYNPTGLELAQGVSDSSGNITFTLTYQTANDQVTESPLANAFVNFNPVNMTIFVNYSYSKSSSIITLYGQV